MSGIGPLSVLHVLLLGGAAALTIFVLDLSQPLGIAVAASYAALPLLGLLARNARAVIGLAIASILLSVAGMLLSKPGALLEVAFINRGISIALIATISIIALRHLRVGDMLRESLEQQAARDPLTNLFNRRHVFAIVEDELQRFRRYGERCSVILIDADHFKRVNDEFGHPAGDLALTHIAGVCERTVRESDVVGRFGGEEFIIVLPHTDSRQACVVAERIRDAMDCEEIVWQGKPVKVTLSLGVAEVGRGIESFDELLKAADDALYEAKHAGRNHVAIARSSVATLKSANDEMDETPEFDEIVNR